MVLGQIAIPDVGVDIGAAIGTAATQLGAVVAVAVGAYLAFMLVRRGLRWLSKALN